MSTATAYSAIKSYLDANWMTTSLAYENDEYVVPDTPTAFVFVEISGQNYARASIGASEFSDNLWREEGSLWLHVMIPSGQGSLVARTYAQSLIDLLRDAELLNGRLVFLDASVGLGEQGQLNGNYWRLTASIDWRLDV